MFPCHHATFNYATRSIFGVLIAALLTRSPSHPHGIKVRLTGGQVGRVQAVITPGE
ncbi:hypothetical protein BXU09_07940 [Deinococcus sp. LM3]|nr:hypothetical protein BXU09_07940 [Deinococcus sp. LM3]